MQDMTDQGPWKITITRMPWRNKEMGIFLVQDESDQAVEIQVQNLSRPSMVGQVHIGRIQKYLPSLHAAFVDIADGGRVFLPVGRPEELHYVRKHSKSGGICGGDEILLQIVADPIKSKDPIGSSDIVFKSADVLLHMGAGPSGISRKIAGEDRKRLRDFLEDYEDRDYHLTLRTSAAAVDVEELARQVAYLSKRMEELWRILPKQALFYSFKTQPPLWLERLMTYPVARIKSISSDLDQVMSFFDQVQEEDPRLHAYRSLFAAYREDYPLYQRRGLTRLMRELTARTVWLPCGGNLVIDQTEAMNVIDVNSGKMKMTGPKREAILTCNREAAEEIARQLRLRNLSGMILIDFINMKGSEDLHRLMDHLASCCRDDPQKVCIVDATGLGLVEVTRQKKYVSLLQAISDEPS